MTGLDTINIIALVAAIAWASGINLYLTMLVFGVLGYFDYINLPGQLQILSEPLVMFVAGFMYLIEFIVDKVPGLDSLWDAIHTFIRVPAGAFLAMAAVSGIDPALELSALILGGSLAAGTHTTKAATRLMLQSSPEPLSNWTASISEDLLVVTAIWAALSHPWIFLLALIIFICIMIWLLPKLLLAIKQMLRLLRDLFKRTGGRSRQVPGQLIK